MALSSSAPVALVTGANRGIGLETCRQLAAHGFDVVMGARNPIQGQWAAARVATSGQRVEAVRLDVTNPETVRNAVAAVDEQLGRLDVLVNNAAVGFDFAERAVTADLDRARDTIDTNVLGPWRVIQAFLPMLRESPHGRIVNVSSTGGSFGEAPGLNLRGSVAYGVAKAALNALTVKLAVELRDTGILVNAVCPGHTATAPGDTVGRPIVDGAASVVAAALLPDDGPSGAFLRDGVLVSW